MVYLKVQNKILAASFFEYIQMKKKGIVQFYIKKRGFGYIRALNNREEFYIQQKHLLSEIEKGDLVEFEVKENKQGLYAAAVQKIKL